MTFASEFIRLGELETRPLLEATKPDGFSESPTLPLVTRPLVEVAAPLATSVLKKTKKPQSLIGQRIGPWLLEELLGKGAMGAVYRASSTDEVVALKLILPEGAKGGYALDRFRQEARVLEALPPHPAIVGFRGFGEDPLPHLALEFVPGETLADLRSSGPSRRLPWREAVQTLIPVAAGLAHAHEHGIIHRDLKPANILVSEARRIKIADFGLGRDIGDESSLRLTRTNQGMGTLSYVAPEQLEDSKRAGPAADLYSFGALLFKLLTGRPPFTGESAREIIIGHIEKQPPDVRSFVPEVPAAVAELITQLLAKRPSARLEAAGELVERLEECLEQGTQRSLTPSFQLRGVEPGSELAGWRIEREIASGGMGKVLFARKGGDSAALKVLREALLEDEEGVAFQRFEREIEVMKGLDHPNIVRLIEGGVLELHGRKLPYMALEYVDRDLAAIVEDRGPLTPAEAVEVGIAAAQGLAAAHDQTIVHRDVKPANILLAGPDIKAEAIKVTDFGIAALRQQDSELTGTLEMLGSPYYMAPEQGKKASEANPRSDLYSLGATLYFLLTGSRLFAGENPTELLAKHARELPIPLHDLDPSIPKALSTIVEWTLLKDIEDRPESALELLTALREWRDKSLGSARLREIEGFVRAGRKKYEPRRENRWLVPVLLAVILILGATATFVARRSLDPYRAAALESQDRVLSEKVAAFDAALEAGEDVTVSAGCLEQATLALDQTCQALTSIAAKEDRPIPDEIRERATAQAEHLDRQARILIDQVLGKLQKDLRPESAPQDFTLLGKLEKDLRARLTARLPWAERSWSSELLASLDGLRGSFAMIERGLDWQKEIALARQEYNNKLYENAFDRLVPVEKGCREAQALFAGAFPFLANSLEDTRALRSNAEYYSAWRERLQEHQRRLKALEVGFRSLIARAEGAPTAVMLRQRWGSKGEELKGLLRGLAALKSKVNSANARLWGRIDETERQALALGDEVERFAGAGKLEDELATLEREVEASQKEAAPDYRALRRRAEAFRGFDEARANRLLSKIEDLRRRETNTRFVELSSQTRARLGKLAALAEDLSPFLTGEAPDPSAIEPGVFELLARDIAGFEAEERLAVSEKKGELAALRADLTAGRRSFGPRASASLASLFGEPRPAQGKVAFLKWIGSLARLAGLIGQHPGANGERLRAIEAELSFLESLHKDQLVRLTGGACTIGAGRDPADSSQLQTTHYPAHEVMLAPYFLDRTEVTVGQYARFLDSLARFASSGRAKDCEPAGWQDQRKRGADLPVTGVEYRQAEAFARWAGKRLPTEEEWEAAARDNASGGPFAWGDEAIDGRRARFKSEGPVSALEAGEDARGQSLSFVAGKTRSGLVHMTGNVAEWTASLMLPYSQDPKVRDKQIANVKRQFSKDRRVVRGGHFAMDYPPALHVFRRYGQRPGESSPTIGFRCAASP